MTPCPWAPWTTDEADASLRSFSVLVAAQPPPPCDPHRDPHQIVKALCHVAQVKLRKVRQYLAGERVSEATKRRLDVIVSNVASERKTPCEHHREAAIRYRIGTWHPDHDVCLLRYVRADR